MAAAWEFSNGGFALRDEGHELIVDGVNRQVRWVRRSLLGRDTTRTFSLDALSGITLQLLPAPPMTATAVVSMLRTAYAASSQGQADLETLIENAPKGLAVRLDDTAPGSRPQETTLTFAVHLDDPGMVALAHRVGEVAGLGHAGVLSMPHSGAEVRLAREPEPGLEPRRSSADDAEALSAAEATLARAGMPPFDSRRFRSDHAVAEWNPGHRVRFRRRFSLWAVVAFPLSLLLLTGPGILAIALVTGRELNVMNTLILSVVGAAFGIPGAALFLGMLPREVDFDWPAGTLSIRRWPRRESHAFDRLLGLEAHLRYDDSSSGESGGSTRNFRCELKARVTGPDGTAPWTIELLETASHPDPAVPVRQAFPLASELAAALGVSCRVEDYSFRRPSRPPSRSARRR